MASSYTALFIYLLAVLLFLIDIFIPSGGVLILASGIAALVSVYFGFQVSSTVGLVFVVLVVGTIPTLLFVFVRLWPYTPIGRRVMLSPPKDVHSSQNETLRQHIGTVVNNRWPLIPTGQVQIGHKRFNAISVDGKWIETHRRVKVVDVQERLLVVVETLEPLSKPDLPSSLVGQNPANPEAVDPNSIPAEQLGLDSLDDLSLDR